MRGRTWAAAAAAVALSLSVAAPAFAAETFFWNGASTSGQCGAARFDGSLNVDDPRTPGIVDAGEAQKWSAVCSYPTSANQRCRWTTASLVSGKRVGAGLWTIVQDSSTSKTYWDNGTGTVDSPVVCDHLIEGSSHSPKVRIYNTDGTYVNATLYN